MTAEEPAKEIPLSEYTREEILKLIEENEATAELLSISGFEGAFRRAVEQVERGEVVHHGDFHPHAPGR